jgi:hypothetical protein
MRAWLVILVAISAQGCSTDETTQFEREFQAGADCPRLYELRNEAKPGATAALQEEMNAKLRSVQCFGSTSKRAAAVPPNTGTFTVQEYRLYREVMSTPLSIPEAQAIENAGRKHGLTPSVAREATNRVQQELWKKKWFASPDAEIRHASDWNGEKQ